MRVLILLLMLLTLQALAEDVALPEPIPEKQNKVEEIFEKFEEAFRIQAVLEVPEYSLYLGGPAIQGVAYVPSFGPRLGPRIFYKGVGLKFTFPLPMAEVEKNRRGIPDQTDIILNTYWRQNALDLYYLRNRGFYIASPWQEFSVHKPERYPQVPDAVATSFGFNWYYVFHPEVYSLKAAFDQNEFQKVSGGSWLVSPFYNHLELNLGTKFVRGIGDDNVTSLPELSSGRFETVGASFGYGHSYISGRFFASALGMIGPGVEYQNIGRTTDGDVKNVSLAVKINFNASMGFNLKGYVMGLQALLDSISANVSGTEIASNTVSGQCFVGARF